jgi:TPR repeat protein
MRFTLRTILALVLTLLALSPALLAQDTYVKTEDLAILQQQAASGNADAQVELGNRYSAGQGVPLDFGRAVEWYRKAADQGNAVAQDYLGFAYENGWGGLPVDYKQAVDWFQKAANQGFPAAKQDLAALVQQLPAMQNSGASSAMQAPQRGAGPSVSSSVPAATSERAPVATRPVASSSPKIAGMSASAQSKELQLSPEEIRKMAAQGTSGNKTDRKTLNQCNDAKYRRIEGQDLNGDALTVTDAGIACGIWAESALNGVGVADPEVELGFQRACFLPDALSPSQRFRNYCAELGELYTKRGDLDTALAVYQNAPNCDLAFSGADRATLCLLGEQNIFAMHNDTAGQRLVASQLCIKFEIYAACVRFKNLGGSVDLNAVQAEIAADAQAAKVRIEEQDDRWKELQRDQPDTNMQELAAGGNAIDASNQDLQQPSQQATPHSSRAPIRPAGPSDLALSSPCIVHQLVIVGSEVSQHQFTNVCDLPIDFLYLNDHPSPGDNNNSTGVLYPGKPWLADVSRTNSATQTPMVYKMFFCAYPGTPTSQNPRPTFSNPGTVSCRIQN